MFYFQSFFVTRETNKEKKKVINKEKKKVMRPGVEPSTFRFQFQAR